MVASQIYTQIARILVETLGVQKEIIGPDSRLVEDLGLDSVDRAQLVAALETQFKVKISDEALDALEGVGDVIRVVEAGHNHQPPRAE